MAEIREEAVEIRDKVILRGTLTLPEGASEENNVPAFIIMGGMAEGDRNGNFPEQKAMPNMYRDLAHHLTELGFATLRCDRRGTWKSSGEQMKSGVVEGVEDLVAQVKYLEQNHSIDYHRIYACGHSEGALLCTLLPLKHQVKGLILLSGAGMTLEEQMNYQREQMMAEREKQKSVKKFIDKLWASEQALIKKQEKLKELVLASKKDVISFQLNKYPAKWYREHFSYKTESLLNAIGDAGCPVLALTGDKDVQSSTKPIELLKERGYPNVTCGVVPDMDHLLKECTAEKSMLRLNQNYAESMEKPLHPVLLAIIDSWIEENHLV